MEILKTLLWVVQIIAAISIIVLVLLQQGKGADAGATFGSGGSSSLFGASGSANFLSHTTAIGAVIFFITTLALVLVSGNGRVGDLGVMANLAKPGVISAKKTIPESAGKSANSTTTAKKQASGVQIPE